MRLCSEAGCGRAVPDNARFCEECRAEREQAGMRVERPSGAARSVDDVIQREYMGRVWRQVTRPRALQYHPLCDTCKRFASQVVDHRIPARVVHAECVRRGLFPLQRIRGFHLQANLTGLCHGCHNRKTASEMSKDYRAELDELLSKYKPGVHI